MRMLQILHTYRYRRLFVETFVCMCKWLGGKKLNKMMGYKDSCDKIYSHKDLSLIKWAPQTVSCCRNLRYLRSVQVSWLNLFFYLPSFSEGFQKIKGLSNPQQAIQSTTHQEWTTCFTKISFKHAKQTNYT